MEGFNEDGTVLILREHQWRILKSVISGQSNITTYKAHNLRQLGIISDEALSPTALAILEGYIQARARLLARAISPSSLLQAQFWMTPTATMVVKKIDSGDCHLYRLEHEETPTAVLEFLNLTPRPVIFSKNLDLTPDFLSTLENGNPGEIRIYLENLAENLVAAQIEPLGSEILAGTWTLCEIFREDLIYSGWDPIGSLALLDTPSSFYFSNFSVDEDEQNLLAARSTSWAWPTVSQMTVVD